MRLDLSGDRSPERSIDRLDVPREKAQLRSTIPAEIQNNGNIRMDRSIDGANMENKIQSLQGSIESQQAGNLMNPPSEKALRGFLDQGTMNKTIGDKSKLEGLRQTLPAQAGKAPVFDQEAVMQRIENAKEQGIISDTHRDPSRWELKKNIPNGKIENFQGAKIYPLAPHHLKRPFFKYPDANAHWWYHHYLPWRHANWGGIAIWIGLSGVTPIYYNYNVVDNTIYCNGTVVPIADEYSSAQSIAASGSATDQQTEDENQWMPLGIFAVTEKEGEKAGIIIQLAVSKDGNIAGTYDNIESGSVEQIAGAIDTKKQIAAWQIGEGENAILMSTAIANLTKDTSTVLVFFSDKSVENWTLTRLGESEAKTLLSESNNNE